MPKYEITMEAVANFYVEVEAENEDEAQDLAIEQIPELCVSCSGYNSEDWELSLGEFEVESVNKSD